MKILLFSHEFPPMVGGAGSYTYDLAIGLAKNGHNVSVLAGKTKDPNGEHKIMEICNQQNIVIDRYDWINKSRFWFIFWDKLVLKYLKNHTEFDLIIFCNYTSNIIGSKIHKKIKIPYRIIIHGDDVDYFFKQERLKDYIMFRKKEMNNYFHNAEAVISVSNYLQKILLKYAPTLTNAKIVHNGIDLDEFNINNVKLSKNAVLKNMGFTGTEKMIFCAGRLVQGKGQDNLIRIFSCIAKKMNDTVLIIAGDGPDLLRLKKITKENFIDDKVRFLGALSRKDIATYYSSSDLFILLSRLNETFGIVFIEAMALGTPVIGSNLGGVPEVIENGVNGITINHLNHTEIENVIIKVLTNNDFSNRLVSNGYKSVKDKFNNLRMAEETIN
jgi:glycosyltransferase involved in cell wall biosynthesis